MKPEVIRKTAITATPCVKNLGQNSFIRGTESVEAENGIRFLLRPLISGQNRKLSVFGPQRPIIETFCDQTKVIEPAEFNYDNNFYPAHTLPLKTGSYRFFALKVPLFELFETKPA